MADFSFSSLIDHYPPFIERRQISTYFGWLTPSSLRNLDCAGKGPERLKVGKTVIYPTDKLLAWLDDRAQSPSFNLGKPSTDDRPKRQTTAKRGRGRPRKKAHTAKAT
ncbi:hypothetical protein MJO47_07490 [Desulfuromonas sp. KJ2020]|uniref:hypothetical protein n=1 Tax=Desulfuromonas sp. KJ2020 TaxID=2919173 RepID=UPI0020A6E22A|nr:hypothetical protein [Desulfuromonas sp. KJ2020]MCP3176945.1 hypothetical protein [Desulfuromonas sp. KJ2020]